MAVWHFLYMVSICNDFRIRKSSDLVSFHFHAHERSSCVGVIVTPIP